VTFCCRRTSYRSTGWLRRTGHVSATLAAGTAAKGLAAGEGRPVIEFPVVRTVALILEAFPYVECGGTVELHYPLKENGKTSQRKGSTRVELCLKQP